MSEQIELEVPDLHCEGCAAQVHALLDEQPGIQQVQVDVRARRIRVTFDITRTSRAAIEGRLAEAGFRVPATRSAGFLGHPGRRARSGLAILLGLALGALLVWLAIRVGNLISPRFHVQVLTGGPLYALAVAAGLASFFAPCSFPLLVTLVTRQTHGHPGARGHPLTRVLGVATAVSLGALTFLIPVSVAIAFGSAALARDITPGGPLDGGIRLGIGGILVALGIIQLGWLPNPLAGIEHLARPLQRAQARYRRTSPLLGFYLLGFGYLLAGFG